MLELIMPHSHSVVLEYHQHNIVNSPGRFTLISPVKMTLVVSNRLQPKISAAASTGVGLKNLTRRYSLITDRLPQFAVENDHYIARLPLINPENDEGTDN